MEPSTYTSTWQGTTHTWSVKPGHTHSNAYHAVWAWALRGQLQDARELIR
jgi:hypothetical protein